MNNNDFLKGTLSTIILSLLKEHGKMYGYEICQLTKELTDETILLTEGAIYPSLHKLEKKNWICSSKEVVNGRPRKYYTLAKEQENIITQQIQALKMFTKHLNNLIQPNSLN